MPANSKNARIGRIASTVAPSGAYAGVVLSFVKRHLSEWRALHEVNFDKFSPHNPEDELTDSLVIFLNRCGRQEEVPFLFQHQPYDRTRKRTDFSVLPCEHGTPPIMVFESKRLPFPRADRSFEYVSSFASNESSAATGGIQRFRKGDHGKNHSIVGMIAYVQGNTLEWWYNKINEQILFFS